MQMNSQSNCHLVAVSPLSIAPTSYTSDEVLSVLGGKASCRRKFVLYVQLLDDEGKEVAADMTLTASLAYAHDNSPVKVAEGQMLAEPLLFSTFNGVEFPANARPTQMAAGRAAFKLAISLLSSKCDNRMFTVRFQPTPPAAPLKEKKDTASTVLVLPGACYSSPIRSISRKRSRGGGCESKAGRASSLPLPHANLCASLGKGRVRQSESAVVTEEIRTKSVNNSRPSSRPLHSHNVPPRSGNAFQSPLRVETEACRKLSKPGAPFRLQNLQINGPSRLNLKPEPMHPQVAPPMPGNRRDTAPCQGVHTSEIQRLTDASFVTPSGRPEAVPWRGCQVSPAAAAAAAAATTTMCPAPPCSCCQADSWQRMHAIGNAWAVHRGTNPEIDTPTAPASAHLSSPPYCSPTALQPQLAWVMAAIDVCAAAYATINLESFDSSLPPLAVPSFPLSARLPGPFCMSPATQAFFAAYHTAPPVAITPLQAVPRNAPGYITPESGVSNGKSPESVGKGGPESHPSPPSRNGAGEAGGGGCESTIQAYVDIRHGSAHIATPCCDIFQDIVGQDIQFSGPFGDLSRTYSPFSEFPSPRHVMISPRAGGAFVPFSPVSGQFSPVCRILPYYSKCRTPNGSDEIPRSSLRDVPSRLDVPHAENAPPPASNDQIWDRYLTLNPWDSDEENMMPQSAGI